MKTYLCAVKDVSLEGETYVYEFKTKEDRDGFIEDLDKTKWTWMKSEHEPDK